MNKTDFPSARFKTFSVIIVSLNNKGKYFGVIINVVSFVSIFLCGFRVFSV